MNGLNPLDGMTIDDIAQAVQGQIEARKKGPTNPADIALQRNNMDITRNVIVPYQRHEFPKSLYKLKPAGKRTKAIVLSIDVKDPQAETKALADGWQLEPIVLEVKEDDGPDLTDDTLKKLLGSANPIDLPIGRQAKRRPVVQAEA